MPQPLECLNEVLPAARTVEFHSDSTRSGYFSKRQRSIVRPTAKQLTKQPEEVVGHDTDITFQFAPSSENLYQIRDLPQPPEPEERSETRTLVPTRATLH